MGVSVALSFEGPGMARALERIGALEARVRNPAPGFELVADVLEAHVAATWATQGRHINRPWPGLAARTRRARAKRWGYYRLSPASDAGPDGPVLVWTGRGRGSFRQGHAEHVRVISNTGLTWGSQVPYLRYHQGSRTMLGFADAWQQREVAFQAMRLWLLGAEPGAIRTIVAARTRLPL